MTGYETILLVDDESRAVSGLATYLEDIGFDIITAESGDEALQLFKAEKPDLVISDIRMPGMDGLKLMDQIHKISPGTQIILLTAYGSVEDAVKAIQRGAFYYLTKPVNLDELQILIKKAFNSQSLADENKALKADLMKERFSSGVLTAESPQMKELMKTVQKIAESNASVLIEGESGTGKELIAHQIHALSPRAHNAFIPVHCAALTDTLLLSEIFGHEKGAFTGAVERKKGRFERAHQGTLFMDEIGEISADTQVKLLRVLQEGEFERVGGTKTIKVDTRLVAATNRHLSDEVKTGNFREDLFYRINVIYLKVPPLRERIEDIEPLIHHFIEEISKRNGKRIEGIEASAVKALKKYPWPGNIRELKNIIERMIVLSSGSKLTHDLLPEDLLSSSPSPGKSESLDGIEKIADAEKSLILKALKTNRGNKSVAAETLGISRRTLYRKMDEYGL